MKQSTSDEHNRHVTIASYQLTLQRAKIAEAAQTIWKDIIFLQQKIFQKIYLVTSNQNIYQYGILPKIPHCQIGTTGKKRINKMLGAVKL